MSAADDGGPVESTANRPTRDVKAWAEDFSVTDASRIVILICNYRCGTNLFKISASQFAGVASTHEVFSRDRPAAGPHGFDRFLDEVPDAALMALQDPETAMRAYLAWFLTRNPLKRILLDLKYADLGRLGLTMESAPIPQIAAMIARWQLPVVHLMRMSPLREAISFLIATRTGEYQRLAGEGAAKADADSFYLDPREVLETARRCRDAHAGAVTLIQRLGLRHHRLFYEDIRGAARKQAVMRALHAVGVYCEPPADLVDHVVDQRSIERVSNLGDILDHIRREAPELAGA